MLSDSERILLKLDNIQIALSQVIHDLKLLEYRTRALEWRSEKDPKTRIGLEYLTEDV